MLPGFAEARIFVEAIREDHFPETLSFETGRGQIVGRKQSAMATIVSSKQNNPVVSTRLRREVQYGNAEFHVG